VPVRADGASGPEAIAAGDDLGCAPSNGDLVRWGENGCGQLENHSTPNTALPVAVDTSRVEGSPAERGRGARISGRLLFLPGEPRRRMQGARDARPAGNARPALILGALALAVGAYFALDAARFVAKTVPATGVIVGRNGSTYTVRFRVDGRAVEFGTDMPTTRGFARSGIRLGREVAVRYNPDAPGEARVVGAKLWAFPLCMALVGAFAVARGLARLRR